MLQDLPRFPPRPRGGSALAGALMLVLGISGLAACLLQIHVGVTRRQIQSIDNKRAFYLAEAGLSEAIFGLATGNTGTVASAAQPAALGDGLFWVESEYLENKQTQLVSTGLCGGGRASLSVVVEKQSTSVAALGVFGKQSVQIQDGSLVDAYDSSKGPYVPPVLGGPLAIPLGTSVPNARVGTNFDAQVNGTVRTPTYVLGSVTPGPNGTVLATSGVTITGSTAPAAQSVSLPSIEVPAFQDRGDLTVGGLPPVLPAGDLQYGIVRVRARAQLRLTGPRSIVASQWIVEPGAKLVFDATGGPIQIYVTDYLALQAGSTLSCTSTDPTRLTVLVSAGATVDRDGDGVPDPPVTMSASGTLYGSFYAPLADLTIASSLQVFGALAARQIVLGANAKVHFDEALISAGSSANALPKLIAWRVQSLPDQPLVSLRLDPVKVLKASGVVPVLPAAAHEMLDFKIDFLGVDGKRHLWEGKEANFDWSKVASTVKTLRIGDAGFPAGP